MFDDVTRIGLTGLGGWAGSMCDRLLAGADATKTRLVAVCEPQPRQFGDKIAALKLRGINVVTDYQQLLEADIEAVYLPLPIHLHRPYTEAGLRAGKAILCEKPAAGCVDDVDAMIAARDRTARPVAIAFQEVYQPASLALKRRLVAGEFGAVRSASVLACWPRGQSYYARNGWAGRMRHNSYWVLDSPANNALAHYVHIALFLMGAAPLESAQPLQVEAELYRANPIENYDTCSMRVTMDGGGRLLVGLTHACAQSIDPEVVLHAAEAEIRYLPGRQIEIRNAAGIQTIPLVVEAHIPMLATFGDWVRRGPDSAPGATLEMARAHTVVVNAASESAVVVNVPDEFVQTLRDRDGLELRTVAGIEAALRECVAGGGMLHESQLVNWSRPGGSRRTRPYLHFAGPAGGAEASSKI